MKKECLETTDSQEWKEIKGGREIWDRKGRRVKMDRTDPQDHLDQQVKVML